MGLLHRMFGIADNSAKTRRKHDEFKEEVERETAKIRAFRMSEELVDASKELMLKAIELRDEVGAIEK